MSKMRSSLRLTAEHLCRKPGIVFIILPCVLLFTFYYITEEDRINNSFLYSSFKLLNSFKVPPLGMNHSYLVWNSKCQIVSKKTMDPSIIKYIKKEKFKPCSKEPILSRIEKTENNTFFLVVQAKNKKKPFSCCWSSIVRLEPTNLLKHNFDSKFSVKQCENFDNKIQIPEEVEAILVKCCEKGGKKNRRPFYENTHSIVNVEKIRDRLESNESKNTTRRKLSILFLGIDSVSRLNFQRAMPKTNGFLRDNDWILMNGYNKMGENTFPNLMAMLTGKNVQQAYATCTPTIPYKLDNCSMIWYDFHKSGYTTAYGEDEAEISTFNYNKVGFVKPPTDYYLRPYMLASEKLLKSQKRFSMEYCTGPILNFDRIFDYALDFAKTMIGIPYFGFFWTNSISHNDLNGVSSIDDHVLKKFNYISKEGILNDTMIVFLSDHGMRFGEIRKTQMGWYEDRLPFLYFWLPPWFREENPQAYEALQINKDRLISPYDVYETLRDVLNYSGGNSVPSSGCSSCQSLLKPVPNERGCLDVGIGPHWCTCSTSEPIDRNDPIVKNGIDHVFNHIDDLVQNYTNDRGIRLCAKLKLKTILRADRINDLSWNESLHGVPYFCEIQVHPGDGLFEFTIIHYPNKTMDISNQEVSRVDSYAEDSKCLDHGFKQFCSCVK